MFLSRMFLIALAALVATAADAATFTVTNTATSGAGSLHQAILSANADAVADIIQFNIAGVGVKTIGGNLPGVTQPVTIDGYTQTGSAVNTAAAGTTNAVLRIQLDGSALATGDAILSVIAGPTTIRGLSFVGIPPKGFGISVSVGTTGVAIHGCFVGVTAGGQIADSEGNGILVDGSAVVGTSALADRNLISGNAGSGILVRGPGTVAQNNLIGLDADGAPVLGNDVGVQITGVASSGNRIGGTGKGQANRIAANGDEGILVTATAGTGNRFETNRIFDNGKLGIDLGKTGVTPNDNDDSDTGPNGLQNFPEIAHARVNGNVLHVEGVLFGTPGQYRIELFGSPEPDESGFGEGESFLDALLVVIPDGEEGVSFVNETTLTDPLAEVLFVTATAASSSALATSEFSRAVEVVAGGEEIVVTNTNDSGAGSLRAALLEADDDAAPNTVVFDIPGEGPHTLNPANELGISDQPLVIDGYSQPGSVLNSSSVGTNARILIEIDGTDATAAVLGVFRTTALVRGLAIHSGKGVGVRFVDAVGAQIEGCFVGTDAGGQADLGNTTDGVSTGASVDSVVGGFSRANRNLISGNTFRGINARGTNDKLLNNLIGTDADGTADLKNGSGGVIVDSSGAEIGSDEPGVGNVIAGNGNTGIDVLPEATGIAILGNSIVGNTNLGIDVREAGLISGVTENDTDDGDDAIDGANSLQNFPVLASVTKEPGKIVVTGSLDVPVARENSVYRLRFFRSAQCDFSGHGEGEEFLAALNVLIPAGEQFQLQIPVEVPEGDSITATATDPTTNETSEFSACALVGGEPSPTCGDASLNGPVTASDALIVLRTAVGTADCDLCVCDVNDNGSVQASDALSVLRKSVGQAVTLDCPVCS